MGWSYFILMKPFCMKADLISTNLGKKPKKQTKSLCFISFVLLMETVFKTTFIYSFIYSLFQGWMIMKIVFFISFLSNFSLLTSISFPDSKNYLTATLE